MVDLWGGVADRATRKPWTPETLAMIFSCTKAATALCAHMLVARGQLDLDMPVAEYWPEFAAAGKERLPVRMLLNHQAGLPAIDQVLPAAALFDWARTPKRSATAAQAAPSAWPTRSRAWQSAT